MRALFNFEISDSTASRYIQHVRDTFGIGKPKEVPLEKIKEYYGVE